MTSDPRRIALRARLDEGFVLAPGVYDPLLVHLVEETGFDAAYMTGFGTAAAYGYPDTGLVTQTEMAANVRAICTATNLPVIADADTGYGNVLNVRRTVRTWEAAGAAALHLEDQVFPKKCGFMRGKQVIAVDEAVAKVRAAAEARTDPAFVLIARTDTLAVNGWDDVVRRVHAFRDAGADLVFVDGIRNRGDLDEYAARVVGAGLPCLYNGALVGPAEVRDMGFRVQILAGYLLGVAYHAFGASIGGGGDGAAPDAIPAVYDGFTALVAQRAGAAGCAVLAADVAARLGIATHELTTTELVEQVRIVATAVDIPVHAELPSPTPRARQAVLAAGATAVLGDADAPEVVVAGGGHAVVERAARAALVALRAADGGVPDVPPLPFDEVTKLLGLDEVYELERRYATEGAG